MGTARPYISKLERGLIVASVLTIERIAYALGIDIADLFISLGSGHPEATAGCKVDYEPGR